MYPTIIMPTVQEVIPGVEPQDVTDEQDRAYNAHCTALIIEKVPEGSYARTHYPFDLPDGSSDDTVALDGEGRIIILDGGTQ